MMAVENQDVLVGITKGLYPDIAKQYKTTAKQGGACHSPRD